MRAVKKKILAGKIPLPSVAKLDALARKVVMLRDKRTCQRCGKQYPEKSIGMQWCHVFTRRRHHTRWYPTAGAFAGCTGCHTYLDGNPEAKVQFCKGRLGEDEYERLRLLSQSTQRVDRWAIVLLLERELGELEGRE